MRVLGRSLDLRARAVGEAAIGNIAGDRVVEQHDVLADETDLPAQIREAIAANVESVEQDLTFVDLVEARHQIRDGRFTAARAPDQRDGAAGGCAEADIVQNPQLAAAVAERYAAVLDIAAGALERLGAGILLDGTVDRAEHALRRGHAALHGCIDIHEALQRRQHHAHVSNELDERRRRKVRQDPVRQRDEDDGRRTDCDRILGKRIAGRARCRQADIQPKVALIDRSELLALVVLALKYFDDAMALQRLLGNTGGVAHRSLDTRAVPPEGFAHVADQCADRRADDRDEQRQRRAEPDHHRDEHDDRQGVPDQHDDRIRDRFGDLLGIVGQLRDQLAGRRLVEVARRHEQIMLEQLGAQIADHGTAHPAEPVDHQKVHDAAHREHDRDQQRHSPRRFGSAACGLYAVDDPIDHIAEQQRQ